MAAQRRCAVIGCAREGRSQVCPYDGQRHHHGRIHYDGGLPAHSVQFHADAWDYICDEHYALVKTERKQWEREVAQLRHMAGA